MSSFDPNIFMTFFACAQQFHFDERAD